MKLIELHIIQSFPVTCLNRDDNNEPKTAYFGSAKRARVSSQSWKRPIREMAAKILSGSFGGQRSKYQAPELQKALIKKGFDTEQASQLANGILTNLGDNDGEKTKVLLYFSPGEIMGIASAVKADIDEKGEPFQEYLKKIIPPKRKPGQVSASVKRIVKNAKVQPKDMADIAIFGRMVANDHTLMVEGAGLFSHALSTHSIADNEIDFFSAVDDLQPETSEGSGHIDEMYFNSACYYRYVGLNLDLLTDKDKGHLKHLAGEEQEAVVNTFIRASILSVPNARKNSMFGHNPPAFVLGLRREGQPLSLANAFEGGIKSSNGYIGPSVAALKGHYETLKQVYGIEAAEAIIPDVDLNSFCEAMTKDADQ